MEEDVEVLSQLFDDALVRMRNTIIKFQPMKEISLGEFTLLKAIKDNGEEDKGFSITSSDLSNSLKNSKPATSRMLNLVEDKGFIVRTSKKNDRRIVYIQLTELGLKVLDEEVERFKILIEKVINKMGKEDMDNFLYTSKKLCEVLIETMDEYN